MGIAGDNQLLSAQQTDYAYQDPQLTLTPQNIPGQHSIAIKQSAGTVSEAVTLKASVRFTPSLETDLRWSVANGVESGTLMATGVLSFDASAVYDFQAAASYNPDPVVLSTRTYTSFYDVGVPVYQEVTLTVSATITASASAAINASTAVNATNTVSVGVTYNPATRQWVPVLNQTASQSLTAQININGGVTAEVRLIPEIEVKFYKVIAGTLSLEPYLDGDIQAAQISSNPVILNALAPSLLQPTQFNASLGIQSNISASMTTLWKNISLLPKTAIAGTTIPLFSLPTLQLQGIGSSMSVGVAQPLTLSVSNGTNNNFAPASIQWQVIPDSSVGKAGAATIADQGCIQNLTGYTCTASMNPQTAGNIDIVASGYGVLGTVATQFAIATGTIGGDCQIGSPGPAGGKIFYISSTTPCHGIEAAPVDQASATWGCWSDDSTATTPFNPTYTAVGATSLAIGTGAANTSAIIAACGSTVSGSIKFAIPAGPNAAATAAAYSLNGYNDWYLPSENELTELHLNYVVVGGFAGNVYWSSSESAGGGAWSQVFPDGQLFDANTVNTFRVRAVRAF